MTSNTVNAKSELIPRLNLWAKERFDGAAIFSSVLLYFVIAVPTRVISGHPHLLSWIDLAGALLLVSFFLLLRIFDEHKDYAEDLILHPQRILSQGIVSLKELKNLGYVCLAIQVLVVLLLGTFSSWIFYIVCLAWGLLMLKEFFVRDWLKKKIFLYVLTHMFIATLIAFWIMGFVGLETKTALYLWPLALIPFAMGFLYELSRKSFGSDEDTRLESYLKVFGKAGLKAMILIVAGSGAYCMFRLFQMIGYERWSAFAMLAYCFVLQGWQKYFTTPTLKTRKLNQATTGLAILLIYVFIIFYSWFMHDKTI